jgi:hypothetical protein
MSDQRHLDHESKSKSESESKSKDVTHERPKTPSMDGPSADQRRINLLQPRLAP